MFTVSDSVHINAPVDRCFLLSTHVGLASEVLEMRPVSGTVAGTLGPGDRVVWAGWRCGLPRLREGRVTRYERPAFFQETLARRRFTRYRHDSQFIEIDGQTLVIDRVRFSAPMGWLGRKIAKRLVVPSITRMLRRRMQLLRLVAEGEQWRRYLSEESIEKVQASDGQQVTSCS